MITKEIASAFASFSVRGSITDAEQITAGLINATYLVKTDADEKYILQKINTFVFKDVEGLMNNIVGVTKHLNEKIKLAGLLCKSAFLCHVYKAVPHTHYTK